MPLELVLTDEGYQDPVNDYSPTGPLTSFLRELVRSSHETGNYKPKVFKILETKCRTPTRRLRRPCFFAIANLVQ